MKYKLISLLLLSLVFNNSYAESTCPTKDMLPLGLGECNLQQVGNDFTAGVITGYFNTPELDAFFDINVDSTAYAVGMTAPIIVGILVTHGRSVISYTELVAKRRAIIKSGMDADKSQVQISNDIRNWLDSL